MKAPVSILFFSWVSAVSLAAFPALALGGALGCGAIGCDSGPKKQPIQLSNQEIRSLVQGSGPVGSAPAELAVGPLPLLAQHPAPGTLTVLDSRGSLVVATAVSKPGFISLDARSGVRVASKVVLRGPLSVSAAPYRIQFTPSPAIKSKPAPAKNLPSTREATPAKQ